MFRFTFGVIVGIMIATVGVTGLIGVIEGGVTKIQNMSRDLSETK